MNECTHLIKDYLCINPHIISNGFYAVPFAELNTALHNMNAHDRPDMYSVVDDKIFIIEHFEFDASRCTSKGMCGKKEEALLERRIEAAVPDNSYHFEQAKYELSLESWQQNFERTFRRHYERIPAYIAAVQGLKQEYEDKKIIVGFFIENQFAPIIYAGKGVQELFYFETRQFAEMIKASDALDFVLFGCNFEGRPQIFYFDRPGLEKLKGHIDLKDEAIQLLQLQQNEVTMYGSFYEESPE